MRPAIDFGATGVMEPNMPVATNQSGTVECQVGAQKYAAQYSVSRGKVTVTCELGSCSGDVKFFRPEFIAKMLLIELAGKTQHG